jgi:hypothetical protein
MVFFISLLNTYLALTFLMAKITEKHQRHVSKFPEDKSINLRENQQVEDPMPGLLPGHCHPNPMGC